MLWLVRCIALIARLAVNPSERTLDDAPLPDLFAEVVLAVEGMT